MKIPNKVKNARKVVFGQDVTTKKGTVIYAKDSEHYIHVSTVEKLEARKVKMKVSKIDFEQSVQVAKELVAKQEEIVKKASK